jgi:hypothetical protein
MLACHAGHLSYHCSAARMCVHIKGTHSYTCYVYIKSLTRTHTCRLRPCHAGHSSYQISRISCICLHIKGTNTHTYTMQVAPMPRRPFVPLPQQMRREPESEENKYGPDGPVCGLGVVLVPTPGEALCVASITVK